MSILNNVKRFDNLYSTNKNVKNVSYNHKTNKMTAIFYTKKVIINFTLKGWRVKNL
jgi:hypothetical protein